MKLCKSCSATKPKSDFGKRTASGDGLSAKCKSCQSRYDKSRSGSTKRAKARSDYKMTDEGKSAHLKASKKYRDKNPNKYKAHNIVNNAIRDGKLFKEPCEICSEVNAVHAHHDDYAKPLNVRWLCAAHHSQWHKKNGEGLNVK